MRIDLRMRFARSNKKLVSKKPATAVLVLKKMLLFSQTPNHPSLALHRLKENLNDVWAISVEYELRILNDLTEKSEPLLVDIGTHHEVY